MEDSSAGVPGVDETIKNHCRKMNGIETVSSQLSESLAAANIDNLLEFLSKKPEDELRLKNLQRGDPDLTPDEKVTLLRSQLTSNPAAFLSRFGHHLKYSHLDSFQCLRKNNYEVNFYVTQLEKRLSPGVKEVQAKNRRYEALQKLVDTTDYFTEEQMQRRDPILFEQLIGRYHSKEEREAFLQLSSQASSSNGQRPTPLSDMLIAHMSRGDGPGVFSDRRIAQETRIHDEGVEDHRYDHQNGGDLEDDDEDEMEMEQGQGAKDTEEGEGEMEEIEDEEKEVFKEEFFTTMYRRFLNGMDEDFDYSTVDDNPEYDCGETLEQDEEDKYFEEMEDSNSNSCKSVCDKEKLDSELSEKVNKDSELEELEELESVSEVPPGRHNLEDDEEDELDLYMKSIEKEVARQKSFS